MLQKEMKSCRQKDGRQFGAGGKKTTHSGQIYMGFAIEQEYAESKRNTEFILTIHCQDRKLFIHFSLLAIHMFLISFIIPPACLFAS